MTAIRDAVNSSALGLYSFICFSGDGGGFLSEFIAYHGVWYQSMHNDPSDPTYCVTAGHVHVGGQISWPTATLAAEVTLRTVIAYVDASVLRRVAFAQGYHHSVRRMRICPGDKTLNVPSNS